LSQPRYGAAVSIRVGAWKAYPAWSTSSPCPNCATNPGLLWPIPLDWTPCRAPRSVRSAQWISPSAMPSARRSARRRCRPAGGCHRSQDRGHPVCQWHDTSVAGHDIAEVQDAVQAVDVAQKRITELTDHAAEPAPSAARIAPVYPLVFVPTGQIAQGRLGPLRAATRAPDQWVPGAKKPCPAQLC
jgi:hypothetical protein